MFLTLDRLAKSFGGLPIIRDLSLEVAEREIVALLGPSGSGKTTLLRLVAGFETPDSGRVVAGGNDLTSLPPERRRVGMVFQHYALFPHMTVAANVAFGLESLRVPKEERRSRVASALAAVGLTGFGERKVTQLSGGQQQRVALARALAPEPRVLLLDEPLSNLDPALRERTRRELKRTIRSAGITTLFVTHEQEEAFDLGDRVAVVNDGRLEQVGTAEELYEEPQTRFVAGFIGRSSALRGAVTRGKRPSSRVRLTDAVEWSAVALEDFTPGEPVDLIVRPEGVSLSRSGGADALQGKISGRRYAGRAGYFLVKLESGEELEALAGAKEFSNGEKVFAALLPGGPPPRVFRRERS